MATLVQRSASTLSVEYYGPKDNTMMDADVEMCRLFGSLNLAGWAPPVEPQVVIESKQPPVHDMPRYVQPEEDTQMTEMTDGEGNVQFIETTPSTSTSTATTSTTQPQPSADERPIEGCSLLQMLCSHYAPRLSHVHRHPDCGTHDSDFNLLETILAHREAFVAFPYGHRSCSTALTKIAFEIERRHNAGMPYNGEEADIDTAIALHNEAWLMSGWYSK